MRRLDNYRKQQRTKATPDVRVFEHQDNTNQCHQERKGYEMSVQNYTDLRGHLGHQIQVASFGWNRKVAIECATCFEVLLDYDNEGVSE